MLGLIAASAGKEAVSAGYNTWRQDRQNRYNAIEAKKQREWQAEMRSTQYQTAVADMEAAGLNPALAYQQGGAGTPGGAAASGGVSNSGVGDMIGSALQLKRFKEDLDNVKKSNELLDAQIEKAQVEARDAQSLRDLYWNSRADWLGTGTEHTLRGTQAIQELRRIQAMANREGALASMLSVGGQAANSFNTGFQGSFGRLIGTAGQGFSTATDWVQAMTSKDGRQGLRAIWNELIRKKLNRYNPANRNPLRN